MGSVPSHLGCASPRCLCHSLSLLPSRKALNRWPLSSNKLPGAGRARKALVKGAPSH